MLCNLFGIIRKEGMKRYRETVVDVKPLRITLYMSECVLAAVLHFLTTALCSLAGRQGKSSNIFIRRCVEVQYVSEVWGVLRVKTCGVEWLLFWEMCLILGHSVSAHCVQC